MTATEEQYLWTDATEETQGVFVHPNTSPHPTSIIFRTEDALFSLCFILARFLCFVYRRIHNAYFGNPKCLF